MKSLKLFIAALPAIMVFSACTTSSPTPEQLTSGSGSEETEVRNLVEAFGKRLKLVSILAPDAAQEMKEQYSEFVSPELLNTWMSDVSKAPGKITSSPWPDRIETTEVNKEGPDRYVITGFVVEVTSAEVMSGEAAFKTPVRIVVEKVQGSWLISEYAEER